MKAELEVIITEELEPLGFDLVELRVGGHQRRPIIDVRIERKDGVKISVDDCAGVSRVLERRFDADTAVGLPDYVLEVSSPGVERPLKRVADWRRFVGKSVSVLSPAVGGRKEFELVDVEGEGGREVVVLKDAKGMDIRVPLAEVKEARLVFHWKR